MTSYRHLSLSRCLGALSARWIRRRCALYAPGNISFRCTVKLYDAQPIKPRAMRSNDLHSVCATQSNEFSISSSCMENVAHSDRWPRGGRGCRRGDAFCVGDSLLDRCCHITAALGSANSILVSAKSSTTIHRCCVDFSTQIQRAGHWSSQ